MWLSHATVLLLAAVSASTGSEIEGCTGCDDWCTADCVEGCVGKTNTHPVWDEAPILVSKHKYGRRYKAGAADLNPAIAVVHVYGTPYQMGVGQGELLAAEINALLPAVIQYLVKSIPAAAIPPELQKAFAAGGIPACLDQVWNLTSPFIPDRFLQEIDGLAAGSKLPVQTVRRVSMMGELSKMGCSMVGAWGPATQGGAAAGGLVQLRALDWDTDGPFQEYPAVVVRHPKGRPAFATAGFAGEVGAFSGISETGVAISEKVWLHYNGSFAWAGQPTIHVLRDILEFGTNLDDSIAVMTRANRTNSIFAGVGSKADGQFRIAEYGHDEVTVWSDTNGPNYGNHTRQPGLVYVDKHSQPDPGVGAWCLDSLMKKNYGKIDALSLATSIVPLYQTGDTQVAVYDFVRDEMYLAYPSPSGWPGALLNVTKAYDRPFVRLDLKALFAVKLDE